MPLIKSTLQSSIENQLRAQFKSEATKQKLREKLDGGGLSGVVSGAKTIYKALGNIKTKTQPIINNTADLPGSASASENLVKRITANEWANAVTEGVCEWLADDVAPILAKTIADEVDNYLKSADVTVTIPPGLVSQGAGPAAVPNVAPIPIKGMPKNPLQNGGLS